MYLIRSAEPFSIHTGNPSPAEMVRCLGGCIIAGGQVVRIDLMDVSPGVGIGLPAAEIFYSLLNGHVQPQHRVWPGQAKADVLKFVQPIPECGAKGCGQLTALVDGVGSGLAVC